MTLVTLDWSSCTFEIPTPVENSRGRRLYASLGLPENDSYVHAFCMGMMGVMDNLPEPATFRPYACSVDEADDFWSQALDRMFADCENLQRQVSGMVPVDGIHRRQSVIRREDIPVLAVEDWAHPRILMALVDAFGFVRRMIPVWGSHWAMRYQREVTSTLMLRNLRKAGHICAYLHGAICVAQSANGTRFSLEPAWEFVCAAQCCTVVGLLPYIPWPVQRYAIALMQE